MRVIGLTGGVACGKSTVAKLFEESQIPVVDADVIAANVVRPGRAAYNAILRNFGRDADILLPNSREIDRAKLREIVFSDPTGAKKQTLNRCTHPYIIARIVWELFYHYVTGMRAVVLDAPLLFETGLDRLCAKTVVVWCPDAVQINRLIQRDGGNEQQARQLIDAQLSVEKKRGLASYVIDNSGAPQATTVQVKRFVYANEPNWPWTLLLWFFPPFAVIAALWQVTRNFLRHRPSIVAEKSRAKKKDA